jgi:DNA-directed RNA polymerase sigma subunit (sigma70/sigma32)
VRSELHVFTVGGDRCSICRRSRAEIEEEARAVTAGLTERQFMIFKFMCSYQTEHGAPPSLREIGRQFNITSTNGVRDHLRALERKRFVRNYVGRARGWVPCQQ